MMEARDAFHFGPKPKNFAMLIRLPRKASEITKYRISSGNLPMNRRKPNRDSFPVRGKRTSKAETKRMIGDAVTNAAMVV